MTNSLSVQHLKENSEAYNIENMKIEMLNGKFAAVFVGGENVGKTVATVTGYKPKVFEIPPSRATTTTTTTQPQPQPRLRLQLQLQLQQELQLQLQLHQSSQPLTQSPPQGTPFEEQLA